MSFTLLIERKKNQNKDPSQQEFEAFSDNIFISYKFIWLLLLTYNEGGMKNQ